MTETGEILARIEQYVDSSDLIQVVTKEQHEEIKLLTTGGGAYGYGLIHWLDYYTALWPHTLLIGGTFLARTVRFTIR